MLASGFRAWTSPVESTTLDMRWGYPGRARVRLLIDAERIDEGISRIAGEIQSRYAPRPILLVGVMTGCLVFLADLMRKLDLAVRVEVVRASSYRGGMTAGTLEVDWGSLPVVDGQHVVLVDDIFDTGQTLSALVTRFRELGAQSVASAVLLSKQGRSRVELVPDFVAFEIPDLFVVGYGLDYQDQLRHLPYVAVLESQDLEMTEPKISERDSKET